MTTGTTFHFTETTATSQNCASILVTPLMCTSGGVIIENGRGEILLQRRRDNNRWCIIGGAMEIGESIIETAVHEAREESGLIVTDLELFGIYTGMDRFITYPNGDICYVTSIAFKTKSYTGKIVNQATEAVEHRFFQLRQYSRRDKLL